MTNSPAHVELRAYESADAAATLRVFQDAILVTAAAEYAPEQLAVWARPGDRNLSDWDRAMLARSSVVALVGGTVAGFSDVNTEGYIDMVFVSPEFGRRGVARELLGFVERRARANAASRLSANVSLTARPLFAALGFDVVAEQQPVIDGIAMTNLVMVKMLDVDRADIPTGSRWQVRLDDVRSAVEQLRGACAVDGEARRAMTVTWLEELFADVSSAPVLRQRAREALTLYAGGMGSFSDVGTAIMGEAVEGLRVALRRAALTGPRVRLHRTAARRPQ